MVGNQITSETVAETQGILEKGVRTDWGSMHAFSQDTLYIASCSPNRTIHRLRMKSPERPADTQGSSSQEAYTLSEHKSQDQVVKKIHKIIINLRKC